MQKTELKSLILKLLRAKKEIQLTDISQSAHLSKDNPSARRAIQRALAELVSEEIILPIGKARSRFYVLKNNLKYDTTKKISPNDPFQGIGLSETSKILLKYLSLPLKSRSPIGYQKVFLSKYTPNKTKYLTLDEKKALWKLGLVEKKTHSSSRDPQRGFEGII
jgi:hypothetical protein